MSSSLESILQWQNEVHAWLPQLSWPQAKVLGRISYAVVMTGQCGLTRITTLLARLEHRSVQALRQQIREFYYEAQAKRGANRQEVVVAGCFVFLLAGILARWQGPKHLALALDASQLGERFVVLSISVLLRQCGLPVAWVLLPVGRKHPWNPEWVRLLGVLAPAVGPDWQVLVFTDQGLYAPSLFRGIQQMGWHPVMRVRETFGFRAGGESRFQAVGQRVCRQGRGWKGQGEWSEQGERIQGTAVVHWERGYEHKWVLVTDLLPSEIQAGWYQMRFWIEAEYKDHKRGGFQWQQTRMSDPRRAERLWLVMAFAMIQTVGLGAQEEAQTPPVKATGRPGRAGRPAKPTHRPRGREQSCLLRGQQAILAAGLEGQTRLVEALVPDRWPTQTFAPIEGSHSWHEKQRLQGQRCRAAQRQQQERWHHAWPVGSSDDQQACASRLPATAATASKGSLAGTLGSASGHQMPP